MWAIIGSSGFESFDEFEVIEELPRETPFGMASSGFQRIKVAGMEALFLPRTGRDQNLLPSHVNYRANIYVLKKYGAKAILALSSVRSLQTACVPGDMVIPVQFLDRTKSLRVSTFCDDNLLGYVSLAEPISNQLAQKLHVNADKFDFKMHFDATYVCIEGPQFPSIIEAKFYRGMGISVIGMSAFPEYALAREAGLHYLPCNFVVDYLPWDTVSNISDTSSMECMIEMRHQNYAKALAVSEWVVHALVSEIQSFEFVSLVDSLSELPQSITPDQQAWLEVILNKKSEKTSQVHHEFYIGTSEIPMKLKEFLAFINKYKSGKDKGISLELVRKNAHSLTFYSLRPETVATVRDFHVKIVNSEDVYEMPVRLYHPNPDENLPLLIYTHGGGFVSGSVDAFDVPVRAIANAAKCVVVAIDYRLAPEHAYPSGIDDVFSVTDWLIKNASSLKADASKVIVMGDSSGANYTLLSLLRGLRNSVFEVQAQILLYPTVDLTHRYASMDTFSNGYLLEKSRIEWYNKNYAPKGKNLQDPDISPLYDSLLSKCPKTLVMTVGYDPLRDEGIALAEKLSNAGVDLSHFHFDNMIHGFINFSKLVPEAFEVFLDRVSKFIKRM